MIETIKTIALPGLHEWHTPCVQVVIVLNCKSNSYMPKPQWVADQIVGQLLRSRAPHIRRGNRVYLVNIQDCVVYLEPTESEIKPPCPLSDAVVITVLITGYLNEADKAERVRRVTLNIKQLLNLI